MKVWHELTVAPLKGCFFNAESLSVYHCVEGPYAFRMYTDEEYNRLKDCMVVYKRHCVACPYSSFILFLTHRSLLPGGFVLEGVFL